MSLAPSLLISPDSNLSQHLYLFVLLMDSVFVKMGSRVRMNSSYKTLTIDHPSPLQT